MTKARRILTDHIPRGRVLVPPFTHKLGPMQEVSWVKAMIPELCWVGLIHQRYGHRRAVQLITALARHAREVSPAEPSHIFATASSFASLAAKEGEDLRKLAVESGDLFEIQAALDSLVSNYPECPLRILFAAPPVQVTSVQPLRDLVSSLYRRGDRDPMMVQASAVWLAFDAGVLKVKEGLALASFPKIEDYPDTELSRQVAASIRSTLNMLFGSEAHFGVASTWPRYFWNRGLTIESCELAHD